MSLLSSLAAAIDQPYTQAVVWPDEISEFHPIRDVIQYLRLWPTPEAQKLQAEFKRLSDLKDPAQNWIGSTYYWVIALSLSTSTGKGLLDSEWPGIAAALPGIDLSASAAVPDYKAIGEYLKTQFDGPSGLRLLEPVWGQAMELNGWAGKKEATDAKKPDSTGSSTSV